MARQLWASGIHEARILAGMMDDPRMGTEEQLEIWVNDFDFWDVCDQCCMNLFEKLNLPAGKLSSGAKKMLSLSKGLDLS